MIKQSLYSSGIITPESTIPFATFGKDVVWYEDESFYTEDVDAWMNEMHDKHPPKSEKDKDFWFSYTTLKWANSVKATTVIEKFKMLRTILIERYGIISNPTIWRKLELMTCHVVEDNLIALHTDMAACTSVANLKSVGIFPCSKGVIVAFSDKSFSVY